MWKQICSFFFWGLATVAMSSQVVVEVAFRILNLSQKIFNRKLLSTIILNKVTAKVFMG